MYSRNTDKNIFIFVSLYSGNEIMIIIYIRIEIEEY
jgi:hypothetical protein